MIKNHINRHNSITKKDRNLQFEAFLSSWCDEEAYVIILQKCIHISFDLWALALKGVIGSDIQALLLCLLRGLIFQ